MITDARAKAIASLFKTDPLIKAKVDEYCLLLKIFNDEILTGKSKCSTNLGFQELFIDFFTMKDRYDRIGFGKPYFEIMDELVEKEELRNFPYVLWQIHEKCRRKPEDPPKWEVSYSSKMLHVFNPDLPIWDGILIPRGAVRRHFTDPDFCFGGVRVTQGAKDYSGHVREYYHYLDSFEFYKKMILPGGANINGNKVYEIGKRTVKSSVFPVSKTKVIDFILWQDRDDPNSSKGAYFTKEARKVMTYHLPSDYPQSFWAKFFKN